MSTKPLVSIVIPLYNRARLVRETLDSLLNQTYQHWEAILIDDGSTDNSFEVVQLYAIKDSRFKLFHRKRGPRGAPTCRNIGVEIANGDYIIFLDSDDLLAPWALSQRIKCSYEYPNFDGYIFQSLRFYNKPGDSNMLWNIQTNENNLRRFLKHDTPWCISDALWRKSMLNYIRFDESLASWQDWQFHMDVLLQNRSIYYYNGEPDNLIRCISSGRISSQFDYDEALNRTKLIFKYYKKYEEIYDSDKELEYFLISIFDNTYRQATYKQMIKSFEFYELTEKYKIHIDRIIQYLKILSWYKSKKSLFRRIFHKLYFIIVLPKNLRLIHYKQHSQVYKNELASDKMKLYNFK